jgi:predicted NBD/HSP70 family sugar kinase
MVFMRSDFLSHSDAALRNRNSVLHYIRYHEDISRTDIWEGMNISRASVTQVIRQLQDGNLIREVGEGKSTGGRRPTYIMFNGEAKKLYIFDWTHKTLYLTDLDGHVLHEETLTFRKKVRPDVFGAALLERIQAIDAMHLCDLGEVIGIGLAMPGLVDSRGCAVLHSVELGWQNVGMQDLLGERFGENIYLERIGNAMALGAYYHGSHRGTNHFQLFITGRDGIGMSTIIHGNCQHGAGCMHGELGHIKLNSDEACSCGQKGCLEAVVSRALADSGEKLTYEILDLLAIGVSTGINISDPNAILMVGSFVNQMSEGQKKYLETAIYERVTGKHMRKLEIAFSSETKAIALDGMIDYVFNQYFSVE